ncbi:MAG: glycosyltransferase family 1 protein, partial [Ignavibacteriales bacterium]|nr:glycosyltransferase family 1 protein [Ignavibacteriales bacterium]
LTWKPITKAFIHRRADDSIVVNSVSELLGHAKVLLGHKPRQIKGRNFEIPGAGGFLLAGKAEYLENYYVPGKEIEVFENLGDLVEKINYFLAHEAEREEIRRLGHERTLQEHTFEKRLNDIFKAMGLSEKVKAK